jgi:hypothetical protein
MRARRFLLPLLVGLSLPLSAHAYVDPGTGMLMWQGLIAAIGAVIVFIRNPITALKRLIARFKRK